MLFNDGGLLVLTTLRALVVDESGHERGDANQYDLDVAFEDFRVCLLFPSIFNAAHSV